MKLIFIDLLYPTGKPVLINYFGGTELKGCLKKCSAGDEYQ